MKADIELEPWALITTWCRRSARTFGGREFRRCMYTCKIQFAEAAYDLPKEIGRKLWKAMRTLSRNPLLVDWPRNADRNGSVVVFRMFDHVRMG